MHKRFFCCLVVSFIAVTAATGENNKNAAKAAKFDWHQWRGPDRDGVSKETGLLKNWPENGPELVWNSRDVNNKKGIGSGYSSVAVADGRIFTVGNSRDGCYLFCLDEKSGKELWATQIAKGRRNSPNSTPTVDGDRVYALGRNGDLACVRASDGKTLWALNYRNDLGGQMMSGWGYSESVLIDGDRLICTPGGDDGALAALNKVTGKVIWKSSVPKGGGAGYASIVTAEVGGIKQYVTWLGRCIVGVNAKDGKLLWRYRNNANGTANIPTAIVRDNLVFCSTGYGSGSALLKLVPDGQGGVNAEEQYFLSGRNLQNHHGGVIRVGDYIYGGHGHNGGQPFCLNMKTGKFAWGPVRGAGERSAAVVYADGHIYYRFQDGTMALVEATPKGYRLKSSFRLPDYTGSPSWPHPVVANGKLYIRGNNVLLCYDLKQH